MRWGDECAILRVVVMRREGTWGQAWRRVWLLVVDLEKLSTLSSRKRSFHSLERLQQVQQR